MAGVPAGLLNARQNVPLPRGMLSPPDERGLLQKLMEDTITGRALKSLYGAATLPGDVYSGAQPAMAFDPQTGATGPNPQMVDRATDLAGSVTLGAGAIPAEANALRMGIKAYHGSPHDFDQFSMDKIGTGEGAQAYGHGLYFAENEGVAKQYREALSSPSSGRGRVSYFTANGKELPVADRQAADIAQMMQQYGIDPKTRDGREWLTSEIGARGADSSIRKKISELLKTPIERHSADGRMYEVDIAANPDDFLDWDKPLSEQPQIQDKLAPLLSERFGGGSESYRLHTLTENPDGQKAFRALDTGGGVISEKLRQAGIPGIRYLDQGSRININLETSVSKLPSGKWQVMPHWQQRFPDLAHPFATKEEAITALKNTADSEGTRNYVVFSDKLITILKKYGLPITAGGVAALSQIAPEEAMAAQSDSQIPQAPPRGGGW